MTIASSNIRIAVVIPKPIKQLIDLQRRANGSKQSLSGWVEAAILRQICDPLIEQAEQKYIEETFSDRLMEVSSRLERDPFDEVALAELERLESVMPDTAPASSTNPVDDTASMSDAQLIEIARTHLGVELRPEDLPQLRSNLSKQMEKQPA
jgi:hypothetical protein